MAVRLKTIESKIKNIILEIKDDIDESLVLHNSFLDLGINSVLSVDLIENINQEFNIDVGIDVVFDYRGVKELAEYIYTEYSDEMNTDKEKEVVNIADKNSEINKSDIAIIGISGRFADSDTIEEFWQHLQEGDCCIDEITRFDWDGDKYSKYHPLQNNDNRKRWGAMLKEVDKFDPLFFNISPLEAERMDPQQRLFIEEAYKAFEDGGYSDDEISGKNIGVFVGGRTSDYKDRTLQKQSISSQCFLGNDMSILAGRISYFFNLKGPSIAVDTACSSSLMAIHLACESIHKGEVEMALAGGVFVTSSPEFYYMASDTGMLSPNGKCKTFDNGANGIVVGEGVGALILKPLEKAMNDGDNIYGVIKGSAVNQDGRTKGITAPSMLSQKNLIYQAYKKSSINPETISYVEAHGTGTKLGDPIEVKALNEAFSMFTDRKHFCVLGSHKPNFGHTIMTAGIAGVFKILMGMKYKKIPPTISVEDINEHIDLDNSPFYINTQLQDWKRNDGIPLRAGVSSFGFSGTNCHMIIEEPPSKTKKENSKRHPFLFPFSAKTKTALRQKLIYMNEWLDRESDNISIQDISYTLLVGRKHFTNRCIIIASDLKELKDKIEQVLHNEVNDDYFDNTNRDFSTIDGVTKNTIEADYILDKLNKSNIDKNEYKEYLTTLAKLYTNNHELDWTKLFAEDAYYRVSMPGYPFDKESYWIQEPEQKEIIKDDEHEVDSMMVPTWDMNVISSEEQFPSKESNIVIIGGNKQVISKMMKQYPNGKVSDINASDNINDIINKLESYDLIEHIIVINSNESLNQLASDDEVGESYGEAILVFRIIKALINLDYDTKNLGLTFITKQSQGIHKDEKINPVYASIHGLIGSLAKEYSNWNIRLVDLEADEQNWPIDSLFYLPVDSQGNPLAYRNGEWYKQKLVPIHQSIPVDTTAYKQGGVYVVIGGAGGIGEVWSEYVIKNYQAKVIWIGRREKDELIQSKIDRLAKLGEKPYYISADATKLSELEQAYKEIKKQYDCINGVIHSAIVLHDSSLANMDEDSFREGLSTKLYISIRMVQVFKKENLDFIMFFSSIMSFTKNAGQSNYASGCTFNDAFAHRLSSELSCAVKVINWGYWGSVGIVASEKYRDRMAQLGYASIEPEEAMKTLELLLNSKFNQIVYMKTLQSFELDAVNKNKVMNVYPPRMDSIVEKLQSSITEPEINISDVISGRNQQMDSLNELLYRLLWKSFKDLGLLNHTVLDITEMKKKINLPNMYDRWFEESISLLAHYDCLSYDGHKHIVINQKKQHHDNVWEEWENKKNIWLNDRDMKAMVILAEAALAELPRILTGQIPATDVIFPDSSIKLVEGIYKNNTVADYYNEMIGNLVVDYIENRRKSEQGVRIRIIEIGAGTGGTTSVVLKKLEAYEQYIEEYCYTDISKLFLINAGERFSDYLYLKYEIFNVEQPIALQNINEDTYDIVIGTNVFHATKNIRHSLRNAKAVLKTNGVIMLNEINNHNIFNHLTFGLLDGWWRYEDKPLRIKGCPNLSGENWERILEWEGFRVVTFEAYNVNELGQQIIIAESDGIVLQQLENTSNVQHENNTINQFKTVNADYNAPSIKGNFTNQMILDNVKETITDNLSKLLKIDINRIDKGQSFADYGLDSITGIHLIQSINQELKTELKTTNIFDYSSVNRLAGYIVDKYKDILNKHYGTSEIIYDDTDITSNNIISTNNVSKDIKVENSTVKMHKHHEIAIIGMSGQFPKSKSVEELWEHLVNGEDLVEEVTRWDLSKYYEQEEEYCNHGGFLEDIDYFDPLFFNISGIEATYMDTQQRLFLEECWNGLEDAGYVGESIKGRTCGVFAGYHGGDYPKLFGDNPPPQSMWGNAGSMISSRIAYYLDLQGPAITVDTACSSSLVAIHLACQNLRMGETEMALAGGVFVQSTPDYYLNGNRAGMLSIKGRCHTFDESADGFVWGEGAGVVVLKRLEDAIKDGDHIYGVIKGSGINQDGKTNGITAPSSKSQERLERYVYDTFNINPEDIQMIEAHGTGTILGDPIEYEALTNAFRSYTDKTKYCSIGSIKTNMGHASAASGVAGLIKILMSLKYKQIPPSLHYKKGNTKINFDDSPFFVNKELSDWKVEQDSKCCAAISAFGFSGTNAHVVIEEAPENTKRHNDNPGYLIVLSARTFQQLQEQVKQLIVHCEQTQELDLGNISYTLLMGRKHFNHRLAYVAQNKTELINQLGKWLEKGQGSQIFVGQKDKSTLQPLLKQYGNECIESCKDSNANEYLEKLSVLANMFIQGYKLNFGKLFDNQYQRISLPTYPFNKEKYWVPEKDNCEVQPIKESNPTRKTKLHPLLHENTSDFWEQRFSSTFTGQEFFLDHHRVGDNKILPGVAYLEMVRVAVSQAANVTDELIKIKNVVWIQPVIVNDDPVNINIRLYPKDDGEISYEIYSLSSGDNTCDESSELIHSQGTVAISADKETRNIDINRLQETCDKDILSSNQCYETFSLVGMNYKEGHKGIDKVYVGNNEVLAKLVLPSVIQNTCDQYILHPCMMDSALQASIGLMLEDNEKKLTLPFTLEEVKIHNSCTKYMWAYLR
ncbi:SDR family NAD(P)-dependent oxidoreductase, partial [Vallitalea guaymasensis]|uniref:SDR family NAD(P)-dependent oxidoreductase n=1 Tax=Vallitalea guaymasensis TaxID=1185412 RepID=UPI0023537C8F